MRRKGTGNGDALPFIAISVAVGVVAMSVLWSIPAMAGGVSFAPAMAAVMGVFLAVALRRNPD